MGELDLRAELEAFRRAHARRELEFDSGTLAYLAGGPEGDEAVLLLPGYFVGAESWFAVMGRLERSRRVLAIDYPRVGTVAALAAALERLLDAERVARVHLVGQSIGGLYAQALAPRLGARVRSLVLAHASLPRPDDLARVRRGNLVGALAPAFVHRAQWARRVAAERPGDDPTTRFWREHLVERARRLAKRDVLAWGRGYADLLAAGELRREDFAPLAGRVLLVQAPDDPVVPADERRRLRDFHAGAREVELPGAGHLSPERRPAELAAAIADFVA